jgi:hypothetical protein
VSSLLEPKLKAIVPANMIMFVRDAQEVGQLIQEIQPNAFKILHFQLNKSPHFVSDSIGTPTNKNSSAKNANSVTVLPVTDKAVFPTTLSVLAKPEIVMSMKCSYLMMPQLTHKTPVSLLTDLPTHPSWLSQFCLSFHYS